MEEVVTAPIIGLVKEVESYIEACFEALEPLDGTPGHPERGSGTTMGVVPTLHEDLVAIIADLSSLVERLNALKSIIM